jgi:tight adherence protein B
MEFLSNYQLAGLDFPYAMGLLGLFMGIFLLMAGLNYAVVEPIRQRRLINQRIRGNKREQQMRAEIFKAFEETESSIILKAAERILGWGKSDNLQRRLLQADIYVSPNTYIIIIIGMATIGYLIGWLAGAFAWSAGLSLLLGLAPIVYIHWKRSRKTLKIEAFMPNAMDLFARSLRAGHTVQGTLELVSQEIPHPLGTEMRITFEEQRLGISINQAFRRMSERVASRDLQFFVTAVIIQGETGGNLSEILENIGVIIRDRLKLKGKVKGLTAEGRFSALVLSLLPVFTMVALYFVNADYILTLFKDPLGTKLLTGALVSMGIGIIVMKRMVAIRV